jgi:adhesin/invasin
LLATLVAVATSCGSSDDNSGDSGTPTNPNNPSNPSGLNISTDSGFSDRTAVVATALPARVHVTQNGQPAANVTVTWAITAGGGKTAPATSTTDATGATSTTWTIGDTVRVNTLSASVTGSSTTMQVIATAGPGAALARASADSSVVVSGSSLVLAVRVVDRFGNLVANTPVSWTTTGGSLTLSSTTTGPSGRAEVVFSTARIPGAYTVSATSAGIGTVTFKVVGL